MSNVLFIGSDITETEILRSALSADFIQVPALQTETTGPVEPTSWPWADVLEKWRSSASEGSRHSKVVVSVWEAEISAATDLVSLDSSRWLARLEEPLAVWFAAMGAAAHRCADGGTVVAVIERPSPLDCAGRAVEAALGEAVEAMVRSLARSEGERGVRVNAVTTPTRLMPDRVVAPSPSLSRYPGSVEADVLGTLRLLLDDDAIGVTGSIIDADDGRSWR